MGLSKNGMPLCSQTTNLENIDYTTRVPYRCATWRQRTLHFTHTQKNVVFLVPTDWPSRGGDVAVFCLLRKPAKLVHSFLFCSCVYFFRYGPFNCISFHKFSWKLSAFSFCSSGLISASMVISAIYLFMKLSLRPDIILCGWLGLKHQLTNQIFLLPHFLSGHWHIVSVFDILLAPTRDL